MSNLSSVYDAIASLPSLSRFATESDWQQIARELIRVSPGAFALWSNPTTYRLPPHLRLLDQAIVEAIDEAAAGRLDGLAVSMPPQHGKSELCSKYLPAWYLGNFPDRRVILVSYEADFAASWGRKARELLTEHGGAFGVSIASRSAAARRWDIAGREGGMSTAGVGGPITGKGAHLLIIDDPIKNDAEARSPHCREKQWEWWQSVASTRLRPGGLTVVVQTRWHRDDLTGKILAQAAEAGRTWRQIKLTALAEPNDPLGRPIGAPLWPEVYTLERLEAIRATRTNYYWQALYQQSPVTDGGTEWPDSCFGHDIWFDDWPGEGRCRVVALDPSKGTDAKFGDDSAFVMLLVGPDDRLYIDADLAVRNTQTIVDLAIDIQQRFRPDWFGVEINQFQELLADQILAAADARNIPIPLMGIQNNVNKLVRIRRLTPLLMRGRLRFKGDSPGARRLVDQLRDFPHGDHDDGPDALEMAIRTASELLRTTQEDRAGYAIELAIAV